MGVSTPPVGTYTRVASTASIGPRDANEVIDGMRAVSASLVPAATASKRTRLRVFANAPSVRPRQVVWTARKRAALDPVPTSRLYASR